jgi:hypothetical protein
MIVWIELQELYLEQSAVDDAKYAHVDPAQDITSCVHETMVDGGIEVLGEDDFHGSTPDSLKGCEEENEDTGLAAQEEQIGAASAVICVQGSDSRLRSRIGSLKGETWSEM